MAILLRAKERAERAGRRLDDRMLFSLGLEQVGRGQFAEALATLSEYLEGADGDWSDERAHAVHQRAVCLRALGRVEEAVAAENEGARERPDWIEFPLGLAASFALTGRWREAEDWAERASAMTQPMSPLRLDPRWLELAPWLRLIEARLARGGSSLDSVLQATRELRGRATGDDALQAVLDDIDEAAAARDPAAGLLRAREALGRYDPSVASVARGLRLDADTG